MTEELNDIIQEEQEDMTEEIEDTADTDIETTKKQKTKKSAQDRINELTAKFRSLERENSSLKDQLASVGNTVNEIYTQNTQAQQKTVLENLKMQIKEAYEESDFDKIADLNMQVQQELTKQHQVPQSTTTQDPTQLFKAQYNWYGEDEIKTALADRVAAQCVQNDPNWKYKSINEQIKIIGDQVLAKTGTKNTPALGTMGIPPSNTEPSTETISITHKDLENARRMFGSFFKDEKQLIKIIKDAKAQNQI